LPAATLGSCRIERPAFVASTIDWSIAWVGAWLQEAGIDPLNGVRKLWSTRLNLMQLDDLKRRRTGIGDTLASCHCDSCAVERAADPLGISAKPSSDLAQALCAPRLGTRRGGVRPSIAGVRERHQSISANVEVPRALWTRFSR